MTWLTKLYSIPVVKATLERMWRGGVVAVTAGYLGGKLVLGDMSFQSGIHVLGTVITVFAAGAISSLLLALGISAATKTGPALNKAEQIKKRA